MSEEHDSWLKSAFGVDVDQLTQAVEDGASALGSAASSALDAANTAGTAVMDAETAAWQGTKDAYNAVTSAYDSVAPNFTQDNKNLGTLVDMGEAAAKDANNRAAAEYADVPVLGTLMGASAAISNTVIDATGGVVKGVGDLATGAGNAIFHPIDTAESMAGSALSIAEHVPIGPPGTNTMVRGIHGLVDLARGKENGEYGSNLEELGENLLMGTRQDPNDPTRSRTNADVDFAAGFGGGRQAWSDKPAEAMTRTITNLLPALLGDEAALGGEPVPEGIPAGEAPMPAGEPPTLRSPGPEPFDPAPSANQPISPMPDSVPPTEMPPTEMPPTEMPPTEPGEPPTLRSPGPEPFDPAPSAHRPISPKAYTMRPGELPEPVPPTLRSPGPEPFEPAPSAQRPISPLADSLRPSELPKPIPPAELGEPPTLRSPGPEPFEPAPSANRPVNPDPAPPPEVEEPIPSTEMPSTEPGAPPTQRSPGPEPFDPAPSVDGPGPSTEPMPPTVPTEPPTFRSEDLATPPESVPTTVPEGPPETQPFPPEEPRPEAAPE